MILFATSCTTGSGGLSEGGKDKTFDIAIGIDLDTTDPAQMTTTTVANVVDHAVETLTEIDKQGQIQPGLAKSWDTTNGGRTVTLQLRSGVTFHDGSKLDAQAVKYNLDRLLDPKVLVPLRADYTSIDKVTAVDSSTVRLDLKHPAPTLVSALSFTTAGIISPESVNKHGNSYQNIVHPVGTGPYTFESYQKGEKVILKKYDDYWDRKPFYSSVAVHIVPEAAARESMLQAGQADMIVLPPVADLKALQQDPSTNVLLAPSDRSIFAAMNTTSPPLDDPKVRQALNYAVNKKAIIENVLFGAGEVMDAPMASMLQGYCKTGSYEYDPQKAKQMLAEADAGDLSLTLGTPTGRYVQDSQAAQAIAGNLRDVGVNVEVRTMDWPSYQAATAAPPKQQKFDLHILGWAPAFPDAQQQMQQFQSSEHPPEGLATSFYSNPKVDSLVAQANRETDQQKRNKLYCQASEIIWREAPWVFLWIQKYPIAYSSEVTNVSYLPNEKFNTIYARPAK